MKQPLWIALWLIAIEAIVITALLPGEWTAQVIEKESVLLEKRFGEEEREWVHGKATSWFNSTLIDNGLHSVIRDHLIPTKEQSEVSVGMQTMGKSWFAWVDGRLQAIVNTYYNILLRFALLLTWLPFILILLIPALYDGVTTWRIKRTNFAYASPLLHQYSTYGITYIGIFLVFIFLAPIVLEPMIIPASIMIASVLGGVMIGNFQKRM